MTSRVPILRVRLSLITEGAGRLSRQSIRSPAEAGRVLAALTAGADREEFWALLLDARHRPLGATQVAVGSLTASLVHPREVFKAAVLANAAAVIVGHTHPSGDLTPSPEDLEVTRRLVQAGRILGIRLLDHLILGAGGRCLSLGDRAFGILEPWTNGPGAPGADDPARPTRPAAGKRLERTRHAS